MFQQWRYTVPVQDVYLYIHYPTDNAPLINFRLGSDAEILLISTDWAYKSAPNIRTKTCTCDVHRFQLTFHFARHRWWLGMLLPTSIHPYLRPVSHASAQHPGPPVDPQVPEHRRQLLLRRRRRRRRRCAAHAAQAQAEQRRPRQEKG